MRINSLSARPVGDSRGLPTVEVTLVTDRFDATASAPSGKSTGSHEAKELRDPDGSVTTALSHVEGEIASALVGREFDSPEEVDAALIKLDGTHDKSRLGANAILPISIAASRLDALEHDEPLWRAFARRSQSTPRAPRLYINMMNGGVHADFKLPFQEYLVLIEGSSSEALARAHEVFAALGKRLGSVAMGDEGGYAPTMGGLEEPLEHLRAVCEGQSGISIALDAAASELYHDGVYTLNDQHLSPDELRALYVKLVTTYGLHSIEDPFFEDAPNDFAALTAEIGTRTLVVGDDFTVTNPVRIKAAHEAKAITAVLIKPNQIGTVSEAIDAVKLTRSYGYEPIASHRSGETLDTFIADFAYGVGAHALKAGGLGQRERLEKFERLVAIEQEATDL